MISRGSEWHRWEPHIHAPGTILNNQFGAADPWEPYLTTLEGLTPTIEAIAVTDYYITDTYEEFLKHKAAGRLPGVILLFPNIELRLDVAAKSGFVNVHLLVSPEDPDYLSEVKRILKRLQFHAFNDRFDCTREELIKLGKRADPTITDDSAALRHGATQFKVNFDQLRKVIDESEWAKKNILIAVAGCLRLSSARLVGLAASTGALRYVHAASRFQQLLLHLVVNLVVRIPDLGGAICFNSGNANLPVFCHDKRYYHRRDDEE